LALDDRCTQALFGLAEMLALAGRNSEALDAVEAARRRAPDDPRGPRLLGRMYLDQGLVAPAADWFETALRLAPDHPDTLANLGLARQAAGDLDAARGCYLKTLSRAPRHPGALRGLARIAEVSGRPAEALERLEPLVDAGQTEPELVAVYGRLLDQAGRTDEALTLLQRRLDGVTRPPDRMVLLFQLGALFDRLGRYEAAMGAYVEANRLKGATFDPDGYRHLVDRLLAAFSAERLAGRPRSPLVDDRPVLIVGMPRAGTSLVEQILASHPSVHGAGELTELGLLALSTGGGGVEYPESMLGLDQAGLGALSRAYLGRLDQLGAGARRVTDKMWQNFEFLGAAELILPGARVIECVRDPLDTGLSCFFQHFFGQGVAFSYDLGHIGAYYRQYRRIMDHWRRVLSLPMHTVRYERLCTEPEATVRALLAFLDLPWDEACLRSHETERPVRTASYAQVRRPIYRSSIGRQRHYSRWLGPLAAALQDDGGPVSDPAG
jgi:tetratricopeptide (TPR) repeat protein